MTLRRVSGALAGRATRRPHAIELRSRFSVVNLYLNLSCGLCQFGSLRIVYVYSIYKHSIYESGLVHGHGNRATGRRGRRAAPHPATSRRPRPPRATDRTRHRRGAAAARRRQRVHDRAPVTRARRAQARLSCHSHVCAGASASRPRTQSRGPHRAPRTARSEPTVHEG